MPLVWAGLQILNPGTSDNDYEMAILFVKFLLFLMRVRTVEEHRGRKLSKKFQNFWNNPTMEFSIFQPPKTGKYGRISFNLS